MREWQASAAHTSNGPVQAWDMVKANKKSGCSATRARRHERDSRWSTWQGTRQRRCTEKDDIFDAVEQGARGNIPHKVCIPN